MTEESKAETSDPEQPSTEAAQAQAAAPPDRGELFSAARLALLSKVVPALWLVAVFVSGAIYGVQLAFLVLAGGVLTLVITLMWSSVQSLTGAATLGFEEALGMGAPSRMEEEKRAVLRALKDLEYERGVGKISPEDYAELSAKYRAQAKRLMQSLDEALAPAREAVEQSIAERLAKAGVAAPEAPEKPAQNPPKTPETSEAES